MSNSHTRLTMYALISAIESDLRDAIQDCCGSMLLKDFINDENSVNKIYERVKRDSTISHEQLSVSGALDYFDFSDTYKNINVNANLFPTQMSQCINENTPLFEKISPIRNRVMHFRPLHYEDLPTIVDGCTHLTHSTSFSWRRIKETFEKLNSNPGYVLSLEIPAYDSSNRDNHNLPLPDFDETGLIGREDIVKKIKELCRGPYPVISIVGEGGIGKSAVALKVAYDILDDATFHYDAVIWVSSKTTQISVAEIIDIQGAIKTSLDMFSDIAVQLGGTIDNPIEEVLEYLAEFKILLFIDNLETILNTQVRDFFGSLPSGSKVIMTSRIGLGAYEYPLKLSGLDAKNASYLLRQLAKRRDVPSIKTAGPGMLANYCQRMLYNPGYIKWFISAVRTGVSPEDALQHSDTFLDFSMSNVYNYLSEEAKKLISGFLLVPNWKEPAELAYFLNFEAVLIQKYLQELLSTNMLIESSRTSYNTIRTVYQLSELARAFLAKHHHISQNVKDSINKMKNTLRSIQNYQDPANHDRSRYNPTQIKIRLKSDRLITKQLRDALEYTNKRQLVEAFKIFDETRRLAPDYFEVHRVIAYYYTVTGDYAEARRSYELAIQQAPQLPQLHYWYGNFLLNKDDSLDEAVSFLRKAQEIDSGSVEVKISLLRCYMYMKNFNAAYGIIADIENIENNLLFSNHIKRMFYDLKIQLEYRIAESDCHCNDIKSSIDHFLKLKEIFHKIPNELKDYSMIDRIRKTKSTVELLKRKDITHDHTNSLDMLITWLDDAGRVYACKPTF